jgi:hypothetical protein
MRLADLHPEWISFGAEWQKVGMFIDCPVHHGAHCEYPRIPVYFANPPSGAKPLPQHEADDGRWTVAGDSFENMTLSPSILYPKPKYGPMHWHGFIRKGEVT